METVDLIIHAGHLYTMEGSGVGYRGNSSLVIENGKIIDVGTSAEISAKYQAQEVIHAEDKVVMPGFIDGHMHARHGFLRGVAQDIRQGGWMMEGMAPFEAFSDSEAKYLGARVTIGEAIRFGTTTLGDDGPDVESSLRVIDEYGARGNVSGRIRDALQKVYGRGELYQFDEKTGQASLDDCLRLMDLYDGKDNGRIRVRFGPQACDFVSTDMLQEVKKQCRARGSKIHMHLQQGGRETEQMLMRYGKRSIPMLAELGYLDDDFIGIHLYDATEDEVRIVAESGASMINCANSIGLISAKIPPAVLFKSLGGRVGLGTDQCAGNNCHNMFSEMKMTAILNKCKYDNPTVFPAWEVLRMATIEGARALGIDDVTGSLEIGKDADLIMIGLNYTTMSPVFSEPMRNIVPNLVYSARGHEVDSVMVKGRFLVRDGKPLTFDLEQAIRDMQPVAEKIGSLSAPKFWEIHGANAVFMENGCL